MAVNKRRRPDDDDEPSMAVVGDDTDDDEQDEDDEEQALPPVRYVRRQPPQSEQDDDAAEQVIPDRVLRIALPAPWAHLRIYGWFDYPKEVADRLSPSEGEAPDEAQQRVMEVLREVIVQHDGWKDRRGRVLPQPSSAKFWELIPSALATAIVRQYFGMVKRNPTPPGSRKSKPKR